MPYPSDPENKESVDIPVTLFLHDSFIRFVWYSMGNRLIENNEYSHKYTPSKFAEPNHGSARLSNLTVRGDDIGAEASIRDASILK